MEADEVVRARMGARSVPRIELPTRSSRAGVLVMPPARASANLSRSTCGALG